MPTIPYLLECALKAPHQDWQKLPGADTVFYDNNKENDGLNKNSSNYSGKQDYELYVRLVAEVSEGASDTHVTEYEYLSGAGTIKNNDENVQASPTWSAAITIKRANGNTLPVDANGNHVLVYGETLTFICVFTLSAGDTADYPDIWGIHRIQKANGGIDLEECSSIRDNTGNRILQETALDVDYTDATHITTTCTIDGTQLVPGQGYNFYARIDYTPS